MNATLRVLHKLREWIWEGSERVESLEVYDWTMVKRTLQPCLLLTVHRLYVHLLTSFEIYHIQARTILNDVDRCYGFLLLGQALCCIS